MKETRDNQHQRQPRMLRGCWLSLLPATDSPPTTTTTTTTPTTTTRQEQTINFPATVRRKAKHHHHHPDLNSILNSIVSDSPSSARRKSSSLLHPHSFHVLPLLENSNSSSNSFKSSFEIRSLQLLDIDKVRELHSLCLPVTYPSSFFYNLLSSNREGIISLVATLPSRGTNIEGYHHQNNNTSQRTNNTHCSTNHHGHHHITSPLSGRKPISLDVVGCITARLSSPPTPTSNSQEKEDTPSVRILTLCVAPNYRRFGIGKMLLDEVKQKFKSHFSTTTTTTTTTTFEVLNCNPNNKQFGRKVRINLHVQATNSVAFQFYLKNGFHPICFKPGYYLNNDLKPLDPALKLPLHPSPSSTNTTCFNLPEKKDIDAWYLELVLS